MDNLLAKCTPKAFQDGFLASLLRIPGVVLAGGAIRDTISGYEPKDYDLFFTKQEALDEVKTRLSKMGQLTDETVYTQTYKVSNVVVQLIFKQIYESKEQMISEFDFTAIQLALDSNGVTYGEKTFDDIQFKYVRPVIITKPITSLQRLVKYAERQWDTEEAYKAVLSFLNSHDHKEVLTGVASSWYNGRE
jgi:hypothetical protein